MQSRRDEIINSTITNDGTKNSEGVILEVFGPQIFKKSIQKNQKDIFLQKRYYSFQEKINIPV